MEFRQVQIVVTVPRTYLLPVLGAYTHCAFYHEGMGRFLGGEESNPAIGERGQIEEVEEYRVETFCDRAIVRRVTAAIRAAHPYEEPAIYLLPLFYDEDFPE